MKWEKIRSHYPHQWVLVEALASHSEGGNRILEDLAVLSAFSDGKAVMDAYKRFHHQSPERELYFLHTDRETPEITERLWLGVC